MLSDHSLVHRVNPQGRVLLGPSRGLPKIRTKSLLTFLSKSEANEAKAHRSVIGNTHTNKSIATS